MVIGIKKVFLEQYNPLLPLLYFANLLKKLLIGYPKDKETNTVCSLKLMEKH